MTPAQRREALRLSRLSEAKSAPKPKSRNLSIMSLVLGLASLTPATFIAGVPAVVCGAVALKQRRPGFWPAVVGIATGAFGTLVLTFALLMPLIAHQRDAGRVAAVKRNMQAFQSALDDYARDHDGQYPQAGISWEPDDGVGMGPHFKGGARVRPGVPANPYTGEPYRKGSDFFYAPEDLAEAGLNAVVDRADPRCPFTGLSAPRDVPGTIVILGWAPTEEDSAAAEYAVLGFGRDTGEPLAGPDAGTFFVLHN